jgi:hypothetical protein
VQRAASGAISQSNVKSFGGGQAEIHFAAVWRSTEPA